MTTISDMSFFNNFQIKAEFARILGRKNPVQEMSEAFQQNWVEKILAFAESRHIAKDVLATMIDALLENPSKKKGKFYCKIFFCIFCQPLVVSYLLLCTYTVHVHPM